MGNVHMEATQINYRGGATKMNVEDAIKSAIELTPEQKTNINKIPTIEAAVATKTDQAVIAPEFDAESGIYAIGDLVMHEGKLYEFTSPHETAGEWNSAEVSEKTVADEVDSLMSGLTDINGTAILSEYKGKSLADQATANGSVGTITKSGYYMVMFTIEHTGADTISGNDPYWEVCLKNSNDAKVQPQTSYPKIMAIPIAKTWDTYMSGVAVYYLVADTYYLSATNITGASTNGMYDSSVRAYVIYLHS